MKGSIYREKGQGYILVLVFMLLGVVMITGLLGYMGNGLKTGKLFQHKTEALYAADAGIEDGVWQINYDKLKDFTDPVIYSPYNYTDHWSYPLSEPVNGKTAQVTIENVWVPLNIPAPGKDQASSIIETGKLMVTDSVIGPTTGQIKITYTRGDDDPPLFVSTLGMWLPPGFTYVPDSTNLWNSTHTRRLYTSENVSDYHSGQAVVWTFSPGYPFAGDTIFEPFPGVDKTKTPMTATITYQFTPEEADTRTGTISWITTSGVSDIPFSWNGDIRIFHITSVADDTTVETYLAKNEIRKLGAAINGDYRAVGNSLMDMGGRTPQTDPRGIRYRLLSESSATINDIPSNANIAAAYLYWSGWISRGNRELGDDYGTPINFKINGNQVGYDGDGDPARGSFPLASTKNQTYPNNATGNGDYSYSCYFDVTDLVRWELEQEGPDEVSYPGNAEYTVSPAAGVKMGDTENEWSYAGWSLVVIYTSPETFGHQLYLFDKFTYAPNDSDIDVTGNTGGPGGVISGFLVPAQVPGDVDVAKMTVFVGEGDWCYAGDFIAFNAPSQYWDKPRLIPDGHPAKLWDGITLGTRDLAAAPYVPNNADRPDNVWNSTSQTGLNDGVDIKTFCIPWASGLLSQGDTSARIDLPTRTDSWNLVYIILSFRSAVKTGGNLSYVIRE
jgi:hypothetical protein